MKYKQFAQEERYMIGHLRRQGLGTNEIARLMERNPSTISREVRRNATDTTSGAVYCVSKAQQ